MLAESVLDLGSGSGMDRFIAGLNAGPDGSVVGLDMTDAQRMKAKRLRDDAGIANVRYVAGYIETLPFQDTTFDVVISNGVVNLSADKDQIFREIARVLRPGGRLALADIVSEIQLSDALVCDTTLWAACIGGTMQQDAYRQAIELAGLRVKEVRENTSYAFLSRSAQNTSLKYGVKSVTLLAVKETA